MLTLTKESRMDELIFDKNEDWDKRVLCSDGACIGVIGLDGKCTECGKPYEGEHKTAPCTGDVPGESDSQKQNVRKDSSSSDHVTDDEWEKRTLCSDGACIGVIGLDGKCTECGKPLEK
jgi:hypothetical protein